MIISQTFTASRRCTNRDAPSYTADKPGCWQGGPTSASTPATAARGCAARVAGPECTHVLEDRKRRPDAASGPDRRPSSLP
jgi:hypothetical protein